MYRMSRVCLISMLILVAWIFVAIAGTVPEEARRHMVRGEAAVEMAKSPEDYEQAIREFQEATRLAPDWADPYYNLGLVQEKAGKYMDAANSLKKYLQLVPDSPDAANIKTVIYKAEFKAEQTLTDEDVLNIIVSLTDKNRWQMKGITNPGEIDGVMKRLRFWRDFKPGNQNRLRFEYYSGTCCPDNKGICPFSVLLAGNSVELMTIYCWGKDAMYGIASFKIKIEVVSRNKVKMSVDSKYPKSMGERKERSTCEFIRR